MASKRAEFPFRLELRPELKTTAIDIEVEATVEVTDEGVKFVPVISISPVIIEPPAGLTLVSDVRCWHPNILFYA